MPQQDDGAARLRGKKEKERRENKKDSEGGEDLEEDDVTEDEVDEDDQYKDAVPAAAKAAPRKFKGRNNHENG